MISGVVKSFASVTLIRVFSRILEFILRIYLIREVLSQEILAQMVALDLILTSSLHITKSCFRPSYQQVEQTDHRHNITSAMNLMTFGIATTIVSAAAVCAFQYQRATDLAYLGQAIALYGVAAILEACKEKYAVSLFLGYQYRKMAIIELLGYLPKTLLLFLAARVGLFQKYGILMFALGQLAFYAIGLLLTFLQAPRKSFALQTLPPDHTSYLDPKTKKVVKELFYISLFKLLLQEFEKILLVVNNEIKDSSVYSLVSSLGSIVVRFVYAPIEEIAYNYYTRGSESESLQTLQVLVKGLGYFSILCIGFGFRYSENVLYILFGEKWLSPEALAAFQAYIVLLSVMGFNGTLEAFVMARADPVLTIPKVKYFNVLSTLCSIGISYILLHEGWGAAGLFLGNTLGMVIRIVISWNIETKKHIGLGSFVKGILPSPLFFATFFSCLLASLQIKSILGSNYLYDFASGVGLFGVVCLPILWEYRGALKQAVGGLTRQKRSE